MSQYIITPNAIRALSRIAASITANSGGAWTLTGPYGTGKSAFCVFLSHLLAPPKDSLTPAFIKDLRAVDHSLAKTLFPSDRRRIGLLPLTASGTSETMQAAILRAITSGVESLGSPPAVRRSLQRLMTRATDEQDVSSTEVVAALERVLDLVGQSKNGPRGILLMLDEMGKLLEFAANNPRHSDVFLLQELAELAARSQGKLFLIGVLHQDFRGYATALPSADRAEWEKIRGRFEDVVFDEPPSQLLRFVALAWQRVRDIDQIFLSNSPKRSLKARAARLWEHELAPPGLPLNEGLTLLEQAAPLHPLCATLIGPMFRRVGQNERSAFSFLSSDDPQALRSFARLSKRQDHSLYDIVDLYGYLTGAIGNGLLHTPDAKRWAEVFEAEAKHPTLSPDAVVVLRAIALLNIASRWYPLRASRETLAFALDERISPQRLDHALDDLRRCSTIVHRKYNDSYTLWEGSDLDVEALLEDGRNRLDKSAAAASLLRSHYQIRPLLARRHAFESGTLRFFSIDFRHVQELSELQAEPEDHDGRIVIVVPRRWREETCETAAIAHFDSRTLFLILEPQDRLAGFALELGAIDWVVQNTAALETDAAARRELHARRSEVTQEIDALIYRLIAQGSYRDNRWACAGTEVSLHSSRQLNEFLSNICDDAFSNAPRIDNELVNRRELSSAAAAARGILIRHMIEAWTLPDLGLDRDPPERSIYRSILSVEGGLSLHRQERSGEYSFRRPPTRSTAYHLFRAIEKFFDNSAKTGASVQDLFELLRRPPYGVRDGVIPIFLCAALVARESDVALYEDGAFCPSLSTALFERLIKAPDRFTLRHWRVTGVRSTVFKALERLVTDPDSASSPGKDQILTVVRPMLRFINSLPEYTLRTDRIAARAASVRDTLGAATEPDELLFSDLPTACGLKPFSPSRRGRSKDVRRYHDELREAFAELRTIYPSLVDASRVALADAFGISDSKSVARQLGDRAAALVQHAVERDLKLLLDRMCVDQADTESWTEGVAGFIAEKPMDRWRDEDQARFLVRLNQFSRRFTLLEATLNSNPTGRRAVASVRISLTGTEFGQIDHALHLTKRAAARANALQTKLEAALDGVDDQHVALAALCQAVSSRLDKQQEQLK